MNIELISVNDLKHAEYNPRKISEKDFEQIKKSIQVFGFVQPLVVNSFESRKGIIIGGNQRFDVAVKLGITEVPVYWINISDINREKELNIRMNKAQAEWDYESLISANDFKIEDLLDWGFSGWELAVHSGENNILKEYTGMPEFDQIDLKPYKEIIVRFINKEDYENFSKLINQNLTESTKSIWIPKRDQDLLNREKIYKEIDES